MRTRTTALVLSLAIALLPGVLLAQKPSAKASAKESAKPISTASGSIFQTKRLANGLEIVVVENHLTPLVTVVYVAKNGSYTEPDEFAGLSHLYEHMFFKKNMVMPNEEAFNERNRELGMSNNASTAEEVVEYHFTMASRNLDPGLEFMSFAITAPAFDPGDIEREREVVLGEFDRDEANPLFPISRALDSAMWGPLLVRKEPLGQRPVIKAATSEKMFAIQHKFYIPNNSALLVVGDVDPQEVYKLTEKYLGTWQKGEAPFPKFSPPPFAPMKKQLLLRAAPEMPSVFTNINFRGPSIGVDTKATYVADLFSIIINNSTSKLYKDIVDNGLALGASINYYTQQNVGPISIGIQSTPEKTKAAIQQLWKELAQWSDPAYFTDAELANAKERIAINRMYEQENPTRFATEGMPSAWAVTGLDYYNSYVDNVKRVTRKDIVDFLRTYIVAQPYAIGIASDQKVLDALHISETEVMP